MNQFSVVITQREHAELVSEPRDSTPLQPDEVAGSTLASLISAGTELAWAYRSEEFPRRPGYAAVFRIEQIGSEVKELQIGDVVLNMGPHCSWQRSRASGVLPVPNGLVPEHAVFARLMGVSQSTLVTTTARPPAKVLVTGLGPVGHLAARIFASCGYEVMACDPVQKRREQAIESGIARVEAEVPLHDAAWRNKTSLVVECSGHEQAVLDGCRLVQKRGEVVLVGVPWQKRTAISAHEILHEVFHRYVVLRSGWEWELSREPADFRVGSIEENLAAALRWLGEKRVRVDGLYEMRTPADCQQAYQDLMNGREQKLAIVFDWKAIS